VIKYDEINNDFRKKYCTKCKWSLTHDTVKGLKITCGIFKSCLDYEMNHKGLKYEVFNFNRGRHIVDIINKILKERIAKIIEEDFRLMHGVPALALNTKSFPITIFPIPNDISCYKCANDQMDVFLTDFLNNCALNFDFNCELFEECKYGN